MYTTDRECYFFGGRSLWNLQLHLVFLLRDLAAQSPITDINCRIFMYAVLSSELVADGPLVPECVLHRHAILRIECSINHWHGTSALDIIRFMVIPSRPEASGRHRNISYPTNIWFYVYILYGIHWRNHRSSRTVELPFVINIMISIINPWLYGSFILDHLLWWSIFRNGHINVI